MLANFRKRARAGSTEVEFAFRCFPLSASKAGQVEAIAFSTAVPPWIEIQRTGRM